MLQPDRRKRHFDRSQAVSGRTATLVRMSEFDPKRTLARQTRLILSDTGICASRMEQRHVSKRALMTVAMVVKISLYDREAEWLAGMPDELVLMHPGPAGVAENGAAVGLSSELQAEVVALEAGNAVGQQKDTPDPVTGHCGNTILGQGCGAFDPGSAGETVQSVAEEALMNLIGGKSVLFSEFAPG
jgi:hypothetical protein